MARDTDASDELHANDDVSALDDVGPKRAEEFRSYGIETVADMAECPHMVSEEVVGGFSGAAIKNQAKDVVRNN
jgi:predicted RecB family nuclease